MAAGARHLQLGHCPAGVTSQSIPSLTIHIIEEEEYHGWILPFSLIIYGIWNVSLSTVLVDSAWHIVEEGLAGILVGVIYRNHGQST